MSEKHLVCKGATVYCSKSMVNNSPGTAIPLTITSNTLVELNGGKVAATDKDCTPANMCFGNCNTGTNPPPPCVANVQWSKFYEGAEVLKAGLKFLTEESEATCMAFGGKVKIAFHGQVANPQPEEKDKVSPEIMTGILPVNPTPENNESIQDGSAEDKGYEIQNCSDTINAEGIIEIKDDDKSLYDAKSWMAVRKPSTEEMRIEMEMSLNPFEKVNKKNRAFLSIKLPAGITMTINDADSTDECNDPAELKLSKDKYKVTFCIDSRVSEESEIKVYNSGNKNIAGALGIFAFEELQYNVGVMPLVDKAVMDYSNNKECFFKWQWLMRRIVFILFFLSTANVLSAQMVLDTLCAGPYSEDYKHYCKQHRIYEKNRILRSGSSLVPQR